MLRTTGLVAGLTLVGRPESAVRGVDAPSIGWIPASLAASDVGYAVGTAPAADDGVVPAASGSRRFVSLTTGQTLVTVAVGADTATARERLRAAGASRLDTGPVAAYGRSVRRRYRTTALVDEAVVTGVGPVPDVVTAQVLAVARTGGTATTPDTVADVVARLGAGRHLSVDVRPTDGVVAAGDRVVVEGDRSRIRTAVIAPDRADADAYLRPVDDAAGVLSTTTVRRDGATVREATVRTDALRGQEVGA